MAPSEVAPASGDEILFCSSGDNLQNVQGGMDSQHELQQVGPCAPSGGDFSGKERTPPVEDAPDPYACPVVEEAPSPINDV